MATKVKPFPPNTPNCATMKLPQLSLRELFLLVALVAMGCGWWVERTERQRLAGDLELHQLLDQVRALRSSHPEEEPFDISEQSNRAAS